jgi:hypothetical protein
MKLEQIEAPDNWEELAYHDLCVMFPEASETEFEQIVVSMENNGFFISDPIILAEDEFGLTILDGRTRHQAALEARVKPSFLLFNDDDPLGFVCSRNLDRRMLSAGQKAALGSSVASLKAGQTPAGDSEVTLEQAARMTGSSTASIKRFRTIQRRDEALAAAVKRGDRTLNEAWEQVKGHGEGNGQQPSEAKQPPSNSAEPDPDTPEPVVESDAPEVGNPAPSVAAPPTGNKAPEEDAGRAYTPPIIRVTLDRGPFQSEYEQNSPILIQISDTLLRLDKGSARHLAKVLAEQAER